MWWRRRQTRGGRTRQGGKTTWRAGPSGRFYFKEYDSEPSSADDLPPPVAGPKLSALPGSVVQIQHPSSSSPLHATAENSSPTISASGASFTPGASAVSDIDSDTTAAPKLYESEQLLDLYGDPYGERIRAEIKLSMGRLLKCLTEYVEGVPY